MEAVREGIEHWLGTMASSPRGVGFVTGSDLERLTRLLKLFERPPTRRVVRLGEAFARALVDTDPPRRHLFALDALDRALATDGTVLLVDRIEALFHPSWQLRVLEALKHLARDRALLVAWPLPDVGACRVVASARILSYATEGHPEYTRAAVGDLPLWCLG